MTERRTMPGLPGHAPGGDAAPREPEAAREPEASREPEAAREPVTADAAIAPQGASAPRGTVAAPGAVAPPGATGRAERRAARVAAGAAELEHRLTDALRAGLAASPGGWREVAARMVDAQAPGLAARARELDALPASGSDGPQRLLEEYALLHLLATAYRRIDGLPAPLAATVRSRVGIPVEAASVLESGPRWRDEWLVLGVRDAAEGALTARRVWLRAVADGRPALLLSFAGPGRSPEPAPPVGHRFAAELAYYPGEPRLRATPATDAGEPRPSGDVPAGGGVGSALAGYGAALAADPWLEAWPVVLADVVPVPSAGGWQLVDAGGPSAAALPVDRRAAEGSGLWRLAALSGGRPLTVFGTCGPLGFAPVTAWAEPTGGVPIPVDVTR